MDASSLAASWLSFAVTAIGLGGLITQARAIQDSLDPYALLRGIDHLGVWAAHQPPTPWFSLSKPPPQGPIVSAALERGLCGVGVVSVSRLPLGLRGKASWTACLSTFHEKDEARVIAGSSTSARTSGAETSPAAATNGAGKRGDEEKGPAEPAVTSIGTRVNSQHHHGHGLLHHEDGTRRAIITSPSSWRLLRTNPLERYNGSACLTIDRATLITLLALSNARQIFKYSDASGLRSMYASYCGHWWITWPIGGSAFLKYTPHDDAIGAGDVYPRTFDRSVEKVMLMVTGVVAAAASSSSSSTSTDGKPRPSFRVAFPGRKHPGTYLLSLQRNGFHGAHGARHLYNMMGGHAFEVDFLAAKRVDASAPGTNSTAAAPSTSSPAVVVPPDATQLLLPSRVPGQQLTMFVPALEMAVAVRALDCLPWDYLSWSIHRGLRDILLAVGRPTMDKHRAKLASTLRGLVYARRGELIRRGWSADFVQEGEGKMMGNIVAGGVLAGEGSAGDTVRMVCSVAALLWEEQGDPIEQAETSFWKEGRHALDGEDAELGVDAVLALTKFFVLEWSNEMDYQMYHDLPSTLYFV